MQLSAALHLARALLNEHGLHDWTVGLDRAKARAGATHFRQRRITLSGPLTCLHDDDLVRDTILHEIAHALVGPRHGHDRVWKAKAREIGASDQRCFDSDAARELAPFIGTCPAGHEVRRHKRPTRVASCTECSSTFDDSHLFEWTYRGRSFAPHPTYARELAQLQARGSNAATAPEPVRLLQLGASARITGIGKYFGRVGEVESVGRTRYQVRLQEGILSVPFELVEPA